MLLENGNITAVHGAVSSRDAVTILNEIKPDVVLADSGLPNNECIELLNEIKESGLNIRVIVLFSNEEVHFQKKYTSFGNHLFFDKYHEFEKIPGAVNQPAGDINE
jgi:DNA-binding NarL/FixJ family response regulator